MIVTSLVRINTDQKEKGTASSLFLYSFLYSSTLRDQYSYLSLDNLKSATQSLVDISPPI